MRKIDFKYMIDKMLILSMVEDDSLNAIDGMTLLSDLEIDSLSAIELLLIIGDELNIQLPLSIFYKSKSISDLVENINFIIEKRIYIDC